MKKLRRMHSDAFKIDAVRQFEVAFAQNPTGAISRVARNLNIAESLLRSWMAKASVPNPSQRALSESRTPAAATGHENDYTMVGRRREYAQDFKDRAVEGVKLAIAANVKNPIEKVATRMDVHGTMVRTWLCLAGYGFGGRTAGGSPSLKVDMDKLIAEVRGEPEPARNLPAVAKQPAHHNGHVVVSLRESAEEVLDIVTQLKDDLSRLRAENDRLVAENRQLRGEREVFIAASSILGTERRAPSA